MYTAKLLSVASAVSDSCSKAASDSSGVKSHLVGGKRNSWLKKG